MEFVERVLAEIPSTAMDVNTGCTKSAVVSLDASKQTPTTGAEDARAWLGL